MERSLTEGLRSWAERNGVRPAEFARKTGYSYMHAYQLLHGNAQAADETLGRVARTYGAGAVAEIVGDAQSQDSTGEGL